jgi:hypothetical protein
LELQLGFQQTPDRSQDIGFSDGLTAVFSKQKSANYNIKIITMEEDIFKLFGDYGTVAILFAWFIYQYFKERKVADANRKTDTDEIAIGLKEHEDKDDIAIALLQQKQAQLETNHLKHQEAIEEWMQRMTCVMVKVANKLEINTDELFK